MIDEIINLFRKELPEILIGCDAVLDVLSDRENHFIYRIENDKPVGVSVINENSVYLLLVDESRKGHGIGTSLLEDSEKYVKNKGYTKIKLGAGKSYIMPGVPMNKNAHKFFEKHGYRHSWGDERCIDMSIFLDDFNCNEHKAGDTIGGNLYRFANSSDIKGIISCCRDDASNFAGYYKNEDLYKPDSSDPVIVAEKDGEILAALMIGVGSAEMNIGYAGCLITAPHHRNKGIATNLLKIGTARMKDMGLERVWLSYTYSAIESTYSRLGYKVCMEYFMGEKEFTY